MWKLNVIQRSHEILYMYLKLSCSFCYKVIPGVGRLTAAIGVESMSCWRRGVVVSGVRRINEVNARRARLVLGWVTVFGRVYHLGM